MLIRKIPPDRPIRDEGTKGGGSRELDLIACKILVLAKSPIHDYRARGIDGIEFYFLVSSGAIRLKKMVFMPLSGRLVKRIIYFKTFGQHIQNKRLLPRPDIYTGKFAVLNVEYLS